MSESICTRQINNYFIKGLSNNKNYKVIDCTVDYSSNYLNEATYLANKQKLDFAISHHLNHSNAPSSNGIEVWTYDLSDKNTYNLASRICEELSNLGFNITNITNSSPVTEITNITKYKNGDYDTRAIVVNTKNLGLNVRADRTQDSLSLGKLKEGQEIVVNYCLNNWFSTYALGKLGYVSGEYIKLL